VTAVFEGVADVCQCVARAAGSTPCIADASDWFVSRMPCSSLSNLAKSSWISGGAVGAGWSSAVSTAAGSAEFGDQLHVGDAGLTYAVAEHLIVH
jgi:hypothetical protein